MTKGYASYDFSAVCETGQTLYYKITNTENHYVELTCPDYWGWNGFDKPAGDIILPAYVYDSNDNQYSVTSIGSFAFYYCNELTGSLTIPTTVTTIGSCAFAFCDGFTGNLTIPNSVVTIGFSAFNGCSGFMGNLIIGGSVTVIEEEAFSGCSGLSGYLIIPNSVRMIKDGAFNGCSGLTGELIIPNSITTIGERAFCFCSGFTGSLTIPNSVTKIGMEAFFGCNGIMGSLIIPGSVTEIGDGAFSCGGFNAVYYTGNINQWCNIQFNGESANPLYFAHNLYIGNELVTNLVIPETVTEIKDYAFKEATCLTSLTIPNSVTSIGNFAFCRCGFTDTLIIPNSVTKIGNYAFNECSGFTGDLSIPNSVTSIGDYAFSGCVGITSIFIPSSVIFIGGGAFGGTGWYNNQPNGIVYLDDCCLGFKGSKPTGSLNIIEGTRIIAGGAFNECSGLTGEWVIPNSVISICDYAFGNCSGFTGNLTIPNSVTMLGNLAFVFCSGFSGNLTIGNSVTSIGYGAFNYCTGFNSLTIGHSVTSIGYQAFGGCTGLDSITVFAYIPPTLDYYDGPFYEIDKTIPVYIPYGTIDAYRLYNGYEGWSSFTNYQEMSYTTIPAYSAETGNWHFIASPLAENTAPTIVDNMIAETPYDLYQFNQSATDGEWQNYKANNFNFANGQGYLYANAEDVNIIFKGTFNEDETKEVELAYDANANLAGWNLVGNPFPVSAYANRCYYVMNEEGTAIEPVAVSMETAIPACTGVMVKVENTGETVTFSKAAPVEGANQGVLQIAVAQADTRGAAMMDKAIVSFNAGDKLEKYVFNKDNAQLYIPRGKNNYAVVSAEKMGEMPLNFEAKKKGTYTITVDTEFADMEYLHLIDNLTGNDVDLLTQPAYTFEAKTADYASRFKLVFSVSGDADGDDDSFAFFNGNTWAIPNEGSTTLQVVDMLGHVISSETINGNATFSTDGFSAGVYMMRLMNGEKVKVQKVVVR